MLSINYYVAKTSVVCTIISGTNLVSYIYHQFKKDPNVSSYIALYDSSLCHYRRLLRGNLYIRLRNFGAKLICYSRMCVRELYKCGQDWSCVGLYHARNGQLILGLLVV